MSDEPSAKRPHLAEFLENLFAIEPTEVDDTANSSLVERVAGILYCNICHELPQPTEVHQCPLGHVMCKPCYSRLLADAQLRYRNATCPNCRSTMTWENMKHNVKLEQTLLELPKQCKFCKIEMSTKNLDFHAQYECPQAPSECRYLCIGCPWNGAKSQRAAHEESCVFPTKNAPEILELLEERDEKDFHPLHTVGEIIELMNCDRIVYEDIEIKPYRCEDNLHKVLYESLHFYAFDEVWIIKMRINDGQTNVEESHERRFCYNLLLSSEPTRDLNIQFGLLEGPHMDVKLNMALYKNFFTLEHLQSGYKKLPLADNNESNRLLSLGTIWLRLWMFLID